MVFHRICQPNIEISHYVWTSPIRSFASSCLLRESRFLFRMIPTMSELTCIIWKNINENTYISYYLLTEIEGELGEESSFTRTSWSREDRHLSSTESFECLIEELETFGSNALVMFELQKSAQNLISEILESEDILIRNGDWFLDVLLHLGGILTQYIICIFFFTRTHNESSFQT